MRLSTVVSKSDENPTIKQFSWYRLRSLLAKPVPRFTKDGPGWIPAIMLGGRKKENVSAMTCFMADIDTGNLDEGRLAAVPHRFLAHTSYSSTPGNRRWRLIIPYDQEYDPSIHFWAYHYFSRLLGGVLDNQTQVPSQFYYQPIARPGYQWLENSGNTFQLSDLDLPSAWFTIYGREKNIQLRWNGGRDGLRDKSDSGLLFGMVSLLGRYFGADDIRRIMKYWPHGRGKIRDLDLAIGKLEIVEQELRLRPLSDYKSKASNWALKPFFPFGNLVDIVGDPGVGKTSFIINFLAKASVGRAWLPGGEKIKPGGTLYFTLEGDPDSAIKPLWVAAGGDASRVWFMDDEDINEDNPITFDNTAMLSKLEEQIKVTGARYIVFDPLDAWTNEDLIKARDTQQFLLKLRKLAKRTKTIIFIIRHMAKSSSGKKAVYHGMGSAKIPAVCRVSYMIVEHEGQLLFHMVKSNLGPRLTVPFEITNSMPVVEDGITVRDEDGNIFTTATVKILEAKDAMDNDCFREEGAPVNSDKLEEVVEWLRGVMAEAEGFIEIGACFDLGRARRFGLSIIRRAAGKLGLTRYGARKKWFWCDGSLSPLKQVEKFRRAVQKGA